jgi:hypothetical protein
VISERLMWLYWVYGLAGRMFGIVRFVEQIRVVVLVSLKVLCLLYPVHFGKSSPECDLLF